MINHTALAMLRRLADNIQYYRFTPVMRSMSLMAYCQYLKENKLGIDTENVDECEVEKVKE